MNRRYLPLCNSPEKVRKLKLAALISLVGNFFLASMKISTAVFTGSLAVLGDGIDSSIDVAIAIMALGVAFVIKRPSDKNHPWGHGRAETVATVILSFIIMLAGFQLVISAIHTLISNSQQNLPPPITLIVTAISVLGKLLLALSQWHIGKKSGSPLILANAKNMTMDILISASVFSGLTASILFHAPILDPIIALLVGLWVMKTALGMFFELNLELMDGNANEDMYRELFEAVSKVPEAGNPHRARIRKIASAWDIDLDIEIDGEKTVREAHNIADAVEESIRSRIPDIYDIMVHVEPTGHGQHPEQFGLCEKDFD